MFDTAISPVISWWRFVFSPLSLIREGLHNSDEDVGHIIRNYWAFPILLVVVTNGLALHFYGIELKSEPLLAVAYLTFAGLNIILDAFIFFVVLRFCGVAVSQRMAFLCFSIMAVYTPLFSWTNIPSTVHTFDLVSYLKAQHLSFNDAISFWFAHTKEINEKLSTPVPMLAPYLSSASAAVYLLSTTLVAECVVQLLKADKLRVYVATGIAGALTFIPQIVVGISEMALMFAFLSEPSS